MKNKFAKIFYYIKRYGIIFTVKKCIKKLFRINRADTQNEEKKYEKWIKNNEPTNIELQNQKNSEKEFKYLPKISIIVPMFNTEEKLFLELYESILNQTYSNWELCFADGSCVKNEMISGVCEKNEKVKYQFLYDNEGISGNTNEAIKMATGDWMCFMDHDDILAPFALYEIVNKLNDDSNVDFIYSDEDKITISGKRFSPYFKPDFSPEMLECHNYITHLVAIKRELQEKVGLLDKNFDGAQDFDFVLRASEKANKIAHISKILYHWRTTKNSTARVADSKLYAYKAGKKAIEAHLERMKQEGTVDYSMEVPGIYQIRRVIYDEPKVSILIPNKDNHKTLKICINSILKLTMYPNYEIIVIENNSEEEETFKYYEKIKQNPKIRVIDFVEKKFNYSKIINYGVKNCDGDYVLQLNNDTKLLTPDWLEMFIGYAQNSSIGAVGARLYYPDRSIQHAGIAVGIGKCAGNLLVNTPYGVHGYYGRETLTANVSAVTGACLFARRSIYEEVGYMDEENFAVAFNDVDFCLKILEKNYRIVYNPFIELIHYESKTRGYEDTLEKQKRFENEKKKFQEKWKDYDDIYYNKNFSRKSGNFEVRDD